MLYTKRRGKKNMARTLKLVFTIFLVVFLFFITENVASEGDLDAQWKLFPTTIACEYATDCPEITIEPDMVVVVCLDGFCQEGPNDPSLP
jgi:hypothetical protein